MKEQLLELIALLEAGIDFAEDDISVAPPRGDSCGGSIRCWRRLRALIASFAYGKLVHEGFTLAIVGRPNVGKSSLFNRLLEQDRAIVTEFPAPRAIWYRKRRRSKEFRCKFVDTAGIRAGQDVVEKLGIERSYQAMADADLTLVVVDLSAPLETADRAVDRTGAAAGQSTLIAGNKCDLANAGGRRRSTAGFRAHRRRRRRAAPRDHRRDRSARPTRSRKAGSSPASATNSS